MMGDIAAQLLQTPQGAVDVILQRSAGKIGN
jgi:hypothetical protein